MLNSNHPSPSTSLLSPHIKSHFIDDANHKASMDPHPSQIEDDEELLHRWPTLSEVILHAYINTLYIMSYLVLNISFSCFDIEVRKF